MAGTYRSGAIQGHAWWWLAPNTEHPASQWLGKAADARRFGRRNPGECYREQMKTAWARCVGGVVGGAKLGDILSSAENSVVGLAVDPKSFED